MPWQQIQSIQWIYCVDISGPKLACSKSSWKKCRLYSDMLFLCHRKQWFFLKLGLSALRMRHNSNNPCSTLSGFRRINWFHRQDDPIFPTMPWFKDRKCTPDSQRISSSSIWIIDVALSLTSYLHRPCSDASSPAL